jgi:hypothetical protein
MPNQKPDRIRGFKCSGDKKVRNIPPPDPNRLIPIEEWDENSDPRTWERGAHPKPLGQPLEGEN